MIAPRHAERVQQMAHESGLAGAERAVQLDEGVAQGGVPRQRARRVAAQAASSGQRDVRRF